MAWNRSFGHLKTDELPGVAKLKASEVSEREQATLAVALAMAKVGVDALGGEAHVDLGGQVRVLGGDNTEDLQGKVQTSVTVTVTVIHDAGTKVGP